MVQARRSSPTQATAAVAVVLTVVGLMAPGRIDAQAPTTSTAVVATADLDMIQISAGGAACVDPMMVRLLIGWFNGVPPHGWPEDVFAPGVESVSIDSGTAITADGEIALEFTPATLDPSDPRARIESSEFSAAAPPAPPPTYEIVYTVTYAGGTTETLTYSRDIGIVMPAVGCGPVPGPPTSEVSPTTVPDGSGVPPALGAEAVPSAPSYTG